MSVYQLIDEQYVEDIKSQGLVYEHVKSGARLVVVKNDDDNKTFSVAFKTIPDSDDGLPHIMEHSVFCGSEKFTAKEPFVNLMKSSLNTFLNAFTCSDKTVYPIASRNNADYLNLIDVYMDSVFFPQLSLLSFLQEGWHYQFDAEGKMSYNGVVFNEMKGAFSDPESYLAREINLSLFPDSPYRFDSGGYPSAIPELTYEKYLQFHREKYHPSNATIVLYGDLDHAEVMAFLDTNYLSRFDRMPIAEEAMAQKRFSTPVVREAFYPIGNGEEAEDKTFLCLNFLLGDMSDARHYFDFVVLDYLLLGSSAAPLAKALRESDLGGDIIDDGFDHNHFECIYTVGVKNSSVENAAKVKELIFNKLKEIVREGFSTKAIEAALNTMNFYFREANYGSFPKGLACQ